VEDQSTALQEELDIFETEIRTGDSSAIMARWKFGQRLNTLKNGKQLPRGVLAQWATKHGVHRSELSARRKFAAKFPTEAEVSTVVESFRSWTRIRQEALIDKPRSKPTDNDEDQVDDKGRNHAVLVRVTGMLEGIESEFLGDDDEPLLTEIVKLVTDLRERKALTAAA
jgi:hypothetical protein